MTTYGFSNKILKETSQPLISRPFLTNAVSGDRVWLQVFKCDLQRGPLSPPTPTPHRLLPFALCVSLEFVLRGGPPCPTGVMKPKVTSVTWESDHLVANSGTPVRLARGLALWAAGREAGKGAGQGLGCLVKV